jgi:hypothetical protein
MDNIFQALFSLQMFMFGLGLVAVTFVFRKFIEFFLDKDWVPANKTSKFWKEVFLPILPVVLGPSVSYFATMYPYPEGFSITSGRVLFGLVAGLLSGLLFRVIKGVLLKNDPSAAVVIAEKAELVPNIEKIVSTIDPEDTNK